MVMAYAKYDICYGEFMIKLAANEEQLIKTKAYMQLLISAFGWSLSTILIKLYIGTIPAYHLLMGRFLIGAISILVIQPKKLPGIKRREVWVGIPLGLLIFASYALGVIALQHTSASKSGFLVALSVLFIPVVQTILQKKLPSWWTGISVVLSIGGLRLIAGINGEGFNYGDLLSIGSAVVYTAYILLLDKYGKEIEDIRLTFIQLTVVAIVSTAAAFLLEGFNPGHIRAGLVPILIIGVFSTAVVTLCQTKAQKVASPESVGILLLAEPLFTLVMAFVILHERILLGGIIGGILILASLVLAVIKKI